MSRKSALKPLTDRMNDYQQGRRATRMMARKTIAESLAAFLFVQTMPLRAGFFGRLTWLFRGMPADQRPTIRQHDVRGQK